MLLEGVLQTEIHKVKEFSQIYNRESTISVGKLPGYKTIPRQIVYKENLNRHLNMGDSASNFVAWDKGFNLHRLKNR